MDKVLVNETDLKLIIGYQDVGYTLSNFFDEVSMNGNYQHLHDKYSYDQLAAIWLGWYEVEKTALQVIKNQLSLRQVASGEFNNGYKAALLYCIRIMESKGVE